MDQQINAAVKRYPASLNEATFEFLTGMDLQKTTDCSTLCLDLHTVPLTHVLGVLVSVPVNELFRMLSPREYI